VGTQIGVLLARLPSVVGIPELIHYLSAEKGPLLVNTSIAKSDTVRVDAILLDPSLTIGQMWDMSVCRMRVAVRDDNPTTPKSEVVSRPRQDTGY